jgi:hypothetical protein
MINEISEHECWSEHTDWKESQQSHHYQCICEWSLIANKIMWKINCIKTVLNEAFQMLNLDEVWIIVDFKVIKTEISIHWCWIKALYVMKILSEEEM